MNNSNIFRNNTIKRFVKSSFEGEISLDYINSLNTFTSNLVYLIVLDSIRRFDEVNECRQIQGLPPKKRLNDEILLQILENIKLVSYITSTEEIGQKINRDTISVDADEMEVS